MAGAGLGFSCAGGGRESLSRAVGRRDSLVPGPTGPEIPLHPARVQHRAWVWLAAGGASSSPARGAFPW